MRPTVWIGMDPGVTGAIATLGPGFVHVHDLCAHQQYGRKYLDVVDLGDLCPWMQYGIQGDARAMIERPRAIRNVNAVAQLHHCWGALEGVLATHNIPYEVCWPQDWQKHHGIDVLSKIMGTKDASLTTARDMFDGIDLSKKKHHGRADALLIAAYARDLGEFEWLKRRG